MQSSKRSQALASLPKDMPVILLTHNPDTIAEPHSLEAALIVCGHTHGGQMRLPLIGSITPIPNQLGRRYDQGIFRLNSGSILAITHGIGESLVRARLFCVPEVLLLSINNTSNR